MRNLVLSLCIIAPATLAFGQAVNVSSADSPLAARLERCPMKFLPEIVIAPNVQHILQKSPSCAVPSFGREPVSCQEALKSLRFVPPTRDTAKTVLPSFQFNAPKFSPSILKSPLSVKPIFF